jgi:hypothetical protein
VRNIKVRLLLAQHCCFTTFVACMLRVHSPRPLRCDAAATQALRTTLACHHVMPVALRLLRTLCCRMLTRNTHAPLHSPCPLVCDGGGNGNGDGNCRHAPPTDEAIPVLDVKDLIDADGVVFGAFPTAAHTHFLRCRGHVDCASTATAP